MTMSSSVIISHVPYSMTYHLSTNVILITAQALAALQALACDDEERSVLAPVLCRQRQGMFALMVRNAFADVVLRLGPLVLDTSLDGETPDTAPDDAETSGMPDYEMWVELLTPRSFSSTRHGIVRRALEQAVAFAALEAWCSGSASGERSVMSERFASLATRWQRTVVSALSPEVYPTIRQEG